MARTKAKAKRGKGVIDLTWLPREDQCWFCQKTLQLHEIFDGFFDGVRTDGTKADDYEEWQIPMAGYVRACRPCFKTVPPDGFVVKSEKSRQEWRLVPHLVLPVGYTEVPR